MSAINKLCLSDYIHDLEIIKAKDSESQSQTKEIFGFKWKQKDSYESDIVSKQVYDWEIEKYFNNDISKLEKLLEREGQVIVDAGCGAGVSSSILFGKRLNRHHYLGINISDSVIIADKKFKDLGIKGEFLQGSLFEVPIPDESVDIIFSEGVLHHTDNTERAIKHLSNKLVKGGHFLFYVYSKKAEIREYTDDLIRDKIKDLNDEEAWNALKPLTQLGISFGKLDSEIEIVEDVPLLGIKKGKINLQRFFYYNFCKAFYRPDYTIEEMNHVNFDWYRPLNCHRQTPEEVKKWCDDANLKIENFNVEESGITVVAKKM